MNKRPSRRDDILQALATMLETQPGSRITTAKLAAEVGVSEAALYRHFPSKAKMFEGLIEFVEDAVFSRVAQIVEHSDQADDAIAKLLHLLLAFTERNPGITRIFNGDALAGEHERLRGRVQQFYDRLEMQLRQILREAELREGKRTRATANATANLLMAFAEGRIGQFVRSDFKRAPTQDWEEQWALLQDMLFR
ncbi:MULTISPECIES: nucleoid occlusion factor SlmA [Spongiibacter]|jgi:TetR/AcrR family transcriptional regulator|uniref:nucleoid occlusion factor SlmA n=1 Tax=Spongiibacter TaxID=630749 RepID=UPI0003B62DF1|nr:MULTISPECIES: nucleoid occlusion factor SlmA [Spongiibacter]MAY38073.1 nucleoid occlusion factor SlmA [Spongiibacter sp.]MBI59431.1 nucleoid occlusion factor SlmA [Spongiibacter sp.]MBO6753218.1 nucleoid occlusion factor SlmA [Spongiibacter sp.]MBU71155.1 nucleoid occlusion factor SlmA [Spongiibacter sp.]|tara:strand:- start:24406 stop:24990 length:585 start_codon:yes stop_codon:yes gene_type:complete